MFRIHQIQNKIKNMKLDKDQRKRLFYVIRIILIIIAAPFIFYWAGSLESLISDKATDQSIWYRTVAGLILLVGSAAAFAVIFSIVCLIVKIIKGVYDWVLYGSPSNLEDEEDEEDDDEFVIYNKD